MPSYVRAGIRKCARIRALSIIVVSVFAGVQCLLPIGFSGEDDVFGHGGIVMFQERVTEMRLYVRFSCCSTSLLSSVLPPWPLSM